MNCVVSAIYSVEVWGKKQQQQQCEVKKSRKASRKKRKLIYGLKAKQQDAGMNMVYFGKTRSWSDCFF